MTKVNATRGRAKGVCDDYGAVGGREISASYATFDIAGVSQDAPSSASQPIDFPKADGAPEVLGAPVVPGHGRCKQALSRSPRTLDADMASAGDKELVRRARVGDRRAAIKLFEQCVPVIEHEVHAQRGWCQARSSRRHEDLFQDGCEGFARALANYEPEKAKGRFKNYAAIYITNRIRNAAIHLSRPETLSGQFVADLRWAFARRHGREYGRENTAAGNCVVDQSITRPTRPAEDSAGPPPGNQGPNRAAFEEETSRDRRLQRIEAYWDRPRPLSLEAAWEDGDGRSLHQTLPAPQEEYEHPGMVGGFEGEVDPETVREAVEDLPPEEKEALQRAYGLEGGRPQTRALIAEALGVKVARVRTLLKRAEDEVAASIALRLVGNAGAFAGAAPVGPESTTGATAPVAHENLDFESPGEGSQDNSKNRPWHREPSVDAARNLRDTA